MAEDEFEEVTLLRTGERPVRFKGKLVAAADEPLEPYTSNKKDSRRWHQLRLFQHQDGRYVIAIQFVSGMETEFPRDFAIVCNNEDEVNFRLTGEGEGYGAKPYDPIEWLEGYPNLPRFETRQEVLESRVTDDFERRVADLLAAAGFVETI